MQVIGPVCVFAGVHVTELPHEDFLCRGVGDHAAVMAAGPIYWRC